MLAGSLRPNVDDLWHSLVRDKTYVKLIKDVRSLWDMGLQLFRKHISPSLLL
ncbi:hypothetical protein TanjilG_09136 [Lupinus angustifolius]|uniref:Uncharacterized protein n=1 Tax=Lupinus angustifolius TaxID=3871 RepID=A0A4P1R3U9_LUPAN|nr:hypothetical protein TanjilG_09136 [Lupinus angustifolius]